ncbi:Oidioi.mRNA.OKI2018_I69.YSR.g17118.t1.cds [Oikopleura dioica]|uniref:Oidioi.mRNA.OKI2018_I69.YSR.g17118.t1.cds n=1 Tax=Oikopleura dioica TaxID=34765 RepID=A0ABN7SJZ6_OIKDI|nr:Oidioi.mRNA.OKI2018_I69.YSR.g17118.t1.cds [Oikopleura dioica]
MTRDAQDAQIHDAEELERLREKAGITKNPIDEPDYWRKIKSAIKMDPVTQFPQESKGRMLIRLRLKIGDRFKNLLEQMVEGMGLTDPNAQMSLDGWQKSINDISRVLSELVREENQKIAEDDRAQSDHSLFYGCLNAAKAAMDVHPLLNIVYIEESLVIPEGRLPAYQERVSALKEKGQIKTLHIKSSLRTLKNPFKSQERTFSSAKIDSPKMAKTLCVAGRSKDETKDSNDEAPPSDQPESPPNESQIDSKNPQQGQSTSVNLERLKGLVWDIQNSLNTNASIPPKRILCYGETLDDKINNLATEAAKIISESQEASKIMKTILQEAEHEGLQGIQLLDAFQTIAIIAHSPSIGINRRQASTNKVDLETIQDTLELTVRPVVEKLMKQVHASSVYNSAEITFWAKMMEPLERDSVSKDDLRKLEEAAAWILGRLCNESAEAIFRMILARCKPPENLNSRASPRMTLIAHIWNIRFKKILELSPDKRHASFAKERQLCISIANSIFGEILFQITNTRCIFPRLLSSAARSA